MKMGRPSKHADQRLTARLQFRMTAAERADLERIARDNDRTMVDVLREAVNEFVSDYRERRVFPPANNPVCKG